MKRSTLLFIMYILLVVNAICGSGKMRRKTSNSDTKPVSLSDSWTCQTAVIHPES